MKKYIVILLLFTSCSTGITLKSVDYTTLLNDNNSKVWIVNEFYVSNHLTSPEETLKKDIMMFYSNGKFNYIGIRDLTRISPRKGRYYLDSELKQLTFVFNSKEEWVMDMEYLTEDSILFVPNSASDLNISFQLKPFPELN